MQVCLPARPILVLTAARKIFDEAWESLSSRTSVVFTAARCQHLGHHEKLARQWHIDSEDEDAEKWS